jgi:hypothetical protein
VQRAYLRILSQHLIECAKDGCASVSAASAAFSGESLDVSATGREFVTKELAEELLAPMLKQGTSPRRGCR